MFFTHLFLFSLSSSPAISRSFGRREVKYRAKFFFLSSHSSSARVKENFGYRHYYLERSTLLEKHTWPAIFSVRPPKTPQTVLVALFPQ